MCLDVGKNSSIKKAETPITCYKVLAVAKHVDCGYVQRFTPFRLNIIEQNILHGLKPFETPEEKTHEAYIEYSRRVEEGYIHTYATECGGSMSLGLKFKPYLNSLSVTGVVTTADDGLNYEIIAFELYKCEIPAGTLYWSGLSNADDPLDAFTAYASKRIVFKECIETIVKPKKKSPEEAMCELMYKD